MDVTILLSMDPSFYLTIKYSESKEVKIASLCVYFMLKPYTLQNHTDLHYNGSWVCHTVKFLKRKVQVKISF